MKKNGELNELLLNEEHALEQAENSEFLAKLNGDEKLVEEEQEVEKERDEKKTEQSKEERSKYANADRKKTIEKLRKREASMDNFFAKLGAKGENFEQKLLNASELLEKAQQLQLKQEIQQQSEKTGINPEILYKARLADELTKKLDNERWSRRMVDVAEYCHAKRPSFFSELDGEDMSRINLMIRNGFTPSQIFGAYAKSSESGEPGISHIKSVAGAKQSSMMDVPTAILKEYERYGISHADALSDYRKQMLKG